MPYVQDSDNSGALPVAVIVPNGLRRRSLLAALAKSEVTVVREFAAYPSKDELLEIARLDWQVLIVDLDENVERAIGVIAGICSHNAAIAVMAYSSSDDSALMLRSMQAGAREFLLEPLLQKTVDEAFARAASRRPQRKPAGKTLVFVQSKGGAGVTTAALNLALTLVKESGNKVVVVDMDFQLGEIASGLGMTATFSVVDALAQAGRLDRELVSTLLMRHSSGLAVLGSPEAYNFFYPSTGEGVKKLFRILGEEFDYVVVDSGTCHGDTQETLFGMADTLYLVTEMTFASLRNAHRLISFLSARDGCRHLEVIANRFNARHGNIDGDSATNALTRPVDWKIPNAYTAVRTAQDSGVPVAMDDSPYTRAVAQMARAACGKPLAGAKKASQGFNLFGLRGLPDAAGT
jgi:pilus assembly protein CpaE